MASAGEAARQIFTATSAKDRAALTPLLHPNVVEDYLPVGRFEGRDAVLDFLETIWAASPGAELVVEQIAEAGNLAFVGWLWEGTFDGEPFQGIRPNGKRIKILGVDRMEMEDGLLRHNTVYYDGLSYARQLGMLPAHASVADRAMLHAFNAKTRLIRSRR